MEVKISQEFLSDLSKLQVGLQVKCRNILREFGRQDAKSIPASAVPGWRLHRLRSSPFISVSLDMNFRMLCKLDGPTLRVCRVVKHDLADAARINRNDKVSTPYSLEESNITARDIHKVLASLGLSGEHLEPFKGISTEDEFLDALERVGPDVQAFALDLYETTGFIIPRSKYTLFDVNNSFDSALRLSMDQWELYLHPSQQFVVDLPASYRLAVSGPAGTGKTVLAWYRIQNLLRQGYSVGFVCPNRRIFDVSRSMLGPLLQEVGSDCYYLLPNSSDDIVQLCESVDHIVVDEGQEIPPKWLPEVGQALAKNNVGITLCYDLNQLGGNIQTGDTSRLTARLKRWQSRILAIPQVGQVNLSINYRNSKEISDFYHEALCGFLPANFDSTVHLFAVGEVVEETLRDRGELGNL